MTEPYRDPDGPIHTVLAAANTVAPRCHLPDGVSLVHARYQYPACVPEAAREVAKSGIGCEVEQLHPWSVRDAGDNEIGIYWAEPDTIELRRPEGIFAGAVTARKITNRFTVEDLRRAMATAVPSSDAFLAASDAAKRRTRRDVAGVIT